MKHVIAFDISMGKSYMVVYNALKKCQLEKEIAHNRPGFMNLKKLIDDLIEGYDEQPHIVLNLQESIQEHWNVSCKRTTIVIAY